MKLEGNFFFVISSELQSQMISVNREHPRSERERTMTLLPLRWAEWRVEGLQGGNTLSNGSTV